MNLADNKIKDKQLETISNMVGINRSQYKIEYRNNIYYKFIYFLNFFLLIVNLSNNLITSAGIYKFFNEVQKNMNLKHVYLDENDFYGSG